VGAHLTGELLDAEVSLYTLWSEARCQGRVTHVYPAAAARQPAPGPAGYLIGTDAYSWQRLYAARGRAAIRVSDWIPTGHWHRAPAYRGLHGYFGATHFLAISLRPGADYRVLTLGRTGTDFTDEQLATATRPAAARNPQDRRS